MNRRMRKITGVALIFAAVIGLLFSLAGIVGTWYFKTPVTESTTNAVVLIQDSLQATADGLELTQQALTITLNTIAGLESTLTGAAQAMEATQPLLESVSGVLGGGLTETITTVQDSLDTVGSSAEVIDTALRFLSAIPLIGIEYNPETPLHESINRVSENMAGIPESLSDMEQSLSDGGEGLGNIQSGLETMASSVGEISSSLEQYNAVFQQYLDTIDQVMTRLESLEQNLPAIITFLAVALTIFFLWMILAQVGLLTQGLDLWKGNVSYDWTEEPAPQPAVPAEIEPEQQVAVTEQVAADNYNIEDYMGPDIQSDGQLADDNQASQPE